MNFRTVRTIRQGLRHGESGQAFTELTISLIPLLAVFVGFLLIAALASDRVTLLIKAREKADKSSSAGVSSQGGESISHWDYGADGIPFTEDDHAVHGLSGDGAYFKNQMADNTNEVTLQNPPGSSTLRSDFSELQDCDLFVNAASLAEGSLSSTSTIQEHKLDSLEFAFRWLFNIKGTSIEETVYMPAHKDLEDRGN